MNRLKQDSFTYLDKVANRLIWAFGRKSLHVAPPRSIVSFTFDDVPKSATKNGANCLERFGVRGTFFISGGLCDTMKGGIQQFNAEEIRALAEAGHELGCHTYAHHPVRAFSRQEFHSDLHKNQDFLKSAGYEGTPVSFAFPYNAAWPFARLVLRQHYQVCRAAGEEINRHWVDPLMLKAFELCQPEQSARDKARHIDDLAGEPGWLIYFVHDISNTPRTYGCTPQTMDCLIEKALENKCEVLPIRDALKVINGQEGTG